MKHFLFAFLLFFTTHLFAQIPAGYYDNATGTGETLKTQLYNIISPHTTLSYPLWSSYYKTDVDIYYENDGTVLDIYSENPAGSDAYEFILGDNQCGNVSSNEGFCYNNEHSFPKSWFNDVPPMNSDLFHIYPTDGQVNGRRSNYPYGEVSNPTWTSLNGSKLGSCSYPGYTGTVFEPIDEFKGDLARTYFYMATCYENVISTWPGSDMLDGSSDKCFTTWALNLLEKWNTNDPVSQKEINRNDSVYVIQGNRNPYIDHPEWVSSVWGSSSVINNLISNNNPNIKIFPNPVSSTLTLSSSNSINNYFITNCLGQIVKNKTIVSSTAVNVDLSDLKSGFYFINTTDTYGQSTVSKFIKK